MNGKSGIKIGLPVAAAIVVVLGTRWLGWWGHRDDVVSTPVATTPAPVVPATRLEPPPAAVHALPVSHDDDPRGKLRLEGQVIDDSDHPVAGAHVAIDANPPMTVDSEQDGSFAFDGLIPRDYELEATAGDRYAGPAHLRVGAHSEPVTLRMRRGGTIEVVVAEPGGKPIASAEVELRSTLTWKATTNSDGIAELHGVGSEWAPLAARANGFAAAAMMLSTSGDPAVHQRIAMTLARGAAVSGRVVDDAGKPVAGAHVVATPASDPFPVVDARRDGVTAAADGTFSLPTIASGTWRFTATHRDYGPTTSVPITLDGTHPRTNLDIALVAGASVRGTVRDPAGKPVGGADVRVVVHGHLPWRARRQAFTADDGTFAVTGLARRAVDVVATHPGGASTVAAVDLAANRDANLALVLDIAGAIDGVVVDSAGTPLGDAQVIAEPVWNGGTSDRDAWSVRGLEETVTTQDGAFHFAGMPPASYHLRAARPGAPHSALSLARAIDAKPGDRAVRVVVAADGRIVGKVAFSDGKIPPSFEVTIGDSYPHPFASLDGTFAVAAAGGTHVLAISGLGFVDKRVPDVAVTEGKDADVGTITVAPGRSVSGRVVDETGTVVANAQVAAGALLTGGGKELYIASESIGAKDTTTDANGRFSLDGFPPSSLTVVAGKDGIGRSASVRLPRGTDSATLDLVLAPTTGLDGKITRNGAPVADTVVVAQPIGALASNFFVATGPDGTFALDALAPGSYIVSPMIGGGGNRPKDLYVRRVDITLGTRARADIDTTPGAITLSIAVKLDDGTVPPAAGIIAVEAAITARTMDELRDGSQIPDTGNQVFPMHIRNAMGGTAEITGMRAGSYTVCAAPVSGPVDDPGVLPISCVPVKLDASTPHASVSIVAPKPRT